jgi:hypothetical protein
VQTLARYAPPILAFAYLGWLAREPAEEPLLTPHSGATRAAPSPSGAIAGRAPAAK